MARKSKKHAEPDSKSAETPRITPGRAKNAVGVAKVVLPAVVPVLAPLAIRTAATVREGVDRARARKLGVDVADLPAFSGKGGALHARIAGDLRGVAELETATTASDADKRFAAEQRGTLQSLTTAVETAERMPTSRRKSVHESVAGELDRVERDLLGRLGVRESK